MNETAKCYGLRRQGGDFDKYLNGIGIDVGAGNAPLEAPNGSVRAWDRSDGDGQLLNSIPDASLDFVYFSHCLEHLEDVSVALANWVRVTKPGGFSMLSFLTIPFSNTISGLWSSIPTTPKVSRCTYRVQKLAGRTTTISTMTCSPF